VHLVEPGGRVCSGALAVFTALSKAPGRGWLAAAYQRIPGFAAASEAAYRAVAAHRGAAEKVTRLLWGSDPAPSTYFLSARLFRRGLGLIFFAAFLSLGIQVDGLIGRDGILPSGAFLEQARSELGPAAYRLVPTLCWLSPGDGFLHALCGGGLALSLLLVFDIAPAAALVLLWAFYLSLVSVGQVFLQYQWDALLLEISLLTIFLTPLRLRAGPGREPSPPAAALFLLRWLLFRLMFSSGIVKLASGDPSWRSLTALTHHYETQPLPTPIAWYAHRLPTGFHAFSTLVMFSVEILAPFFLFAPRRLRHAAAAVIGGLEILIALSGNYAFFNFLTLALCLLAFDDRALAPLVGAAPAASASAGPLRRRAGNVAAGILFALSLIPVAALLRPARWPRTVLRIYGVVEPFQSVNGYGLFAVMTTSRSEIVVEGSRDGREWRAYEFRWKPGDLRRRPRFVEPHQPRLDWQMWFAALGGYRENPWFVELLRRLLEGSPPVLRLLGRNPFPDSPPRYIRATVYDYRFTDFPTRRRTGHWWRRTPIGPYCPVFTRNFSGVARSDGIDLQEVRGPAPAAGTGDDDHPVAAGEQAALPEGSEGVGDHPVRVFRHREGEARHTGKQRRAAARFIPARDGVNGPPPEEFREE
jgi:hypothetical protein